MQLKKAFLIFSFVAVSIFGLMYGISPRWYAATFVGITDLQLNFAHIFRALAALYIALAAFWLYAASHEEYTQAGILTAIIFAGGNALGRCVSLAIDGQPAPALLLYLAAEVGVVAIGCWVFRLQPR
jgi:hypothetical protein